MDILIDNGFAWLMQVNVASIHGDYQIHYWGCACPLKWVHPAYGIDIIRDRGNFEKNGSVVLSMANSVEELQNKLLKLCQDKWANKSLEGESMQL